MLSSIGAPPFDGVIAYGQTDVAFKVSNTGAGVLKFQHEMAINVTRMS